MSYKRILTIQDISCVGQCSMTVALPILSACGHETCILPTALLSTHTGGFGKPAVIHFDHALDDLWRHWQENEIAFDAILVGYLGSIGAVKTAMEIIRELRAPGGIAIVDPLRAAFGPINSLWWVVNIGTACNIVAFIFTRLIDEDNYAVPEERIAKNEAAKRRPLQLIAEVAKEKPFQKLIVFLVLTLGVRLVFTLQFLVMPQYYTRAIGDDFSLGLVNSFNPFIIITGLILIIPILNRFSTVKLMISGMTISACSMILLAIPPEWYFIIPGIETVGQAYFFAIVAQIIVFASGELLFSPRFSEYVARVAPKDKVASYMSLSALPMFIAKPINGVVGGLLVSYFCYDGIAAKMDTGHITFWNSPEFMWTLYMIMAFISPIAIILTKDSFVSDKPEEDAAESASETASEASEDEAATTNA